MKKLLITGANGFLGSNCLNILQNQNFEIYALDKIIPKKRCSEVTWIQADLTDSEEIFKIMETIAPNLLLHLAWTMDTGMKLDSDIHYRWVDIGMNLVQAFAHFGGKRVIVSGTCAEYEWSTHIYKEDSSSVKPVSIYGICKNTLHRKLSTFCKRNNLSYAWGRIFFMYGQNENKKRLIPYVINSIAKGEMVKTSHGNQVYDYLHVEDVARALTKLLEIDFTGPVNICSGNPIRLKDLVYKIANIMDGNHLVQLGYHETKIDEPQFIVGSNHLLKKITNWRQEIDIDRGIKNTIQSHLKEK